MIGCVVQSLMYLITSVNYSAPVAEWKTVIKPSVRVCLSANISLEPLDRLAQNFVRRSPVAVAWSSSGVVALRYVLPVLWMTSRLAVMGERPARVGSTQHR